MTEWQKPEITTSFKFEDDRQPGEEWPIQSERFRIVGRVGRGCWGTVYAAEDTKAQQMVALKTLTPTEIARAQMKDRGLTEADVLKKETGVFVDAANVVPRTLEFDDKGEPFIRMPIYPRTLADAINDERGTRLKVGSGLSLEAAFAWIRGIANGMEETQSKYGIVHPDVSERNIVLDTDDKPLLTDLGSATVTTIHGATSPRDNIGSIVTRPYEIFREGSHPDRRTNSFALGALTYRLFAGEYPWESELDNAIDPTKYMQDIDPKVADTAIRRKIKKNVPRPIRKLVEKCLSYNPDKRPQNGDELKKEVERTISRHYKSQPASRLRRWGLAAAAALAIGGAGFAIHRASTADERAQTSEQRYEHRKKMQMIREYLGDRRRNTTESFMATKDISVWVEIMNGDEKSGFAAYLNPDAVYEAVQKVNGKTDWGSIKGIIRESDYTTFSDLEFSTPGEYLDNWMLQTSDFHEKKVRGQWASARRAYETKKADEIRKAEEERRKTLWGSGTGFSPVGDLLRGRNPTSQPSPDHYNFTGQPPKNP